jgi:hypothetical protein
VRRANATLGGTWPTYEAFDAFMHEDPAFASLPVEEIDHFA